MGTLLATDLATVRAAIKTRLEVVTGFTVYDYLRNINDEATLKAIALDAGDPARIHFWQFGLAQEMPFEGHRYAAGETRVRAKWELHGYYAVNDADATEKTFDTEAAAVFDAFEANKKLTTGGVDLTVETGPAQRQQGGHVMFGTVLCHYARMSLLTVLSLEC